MKSSHARAQHTLAQRDALLNEAVRRREEAWAKWRKAGHGERNRRWRELQAAIAAELRAGSW